MSRESVVQDAIRLAAAKLGTVLWRNNVGAGKLENGNFIRWGLANDSTAVNQKTKSGDLIGIRTLTITPDMVGKTIGQFVSVEVKREGWKFSGSERELAQDNWRRIITSRGGLALFATNEGDVVSVLTETNAL